MLLCSLLVFVWDDEVVDDALLNNRKEEESKHMSSSVVNLQLWSVLGQGCFGAI